MRKLKYIKIFEAFKSNKLTTTLKYTKSESREFLSLLRNVLRNIDFPESDLEESQYHVGNQRVVAEIELIVGYER